MRKKEYILAVFASNSLIAMATFPTLTVQTSSPATKFGIHCNISNSSLHIFELGLLTLESTGIHMLEIKGDLRETYNLKKA